MLSPISKIVKYWKFISLSILVIIITGIFANGHMSMEHERDKGPEGMPSISDMLEAAIKVLKKNKKGYFLMVIICNIIKLDF